MKKILTISLSTLLILTAVYCGSGSPGAALGLSTEVYSYTKLDNGAQIAVMPNRDIADASVSISIFLIAGINSETDGEAGYSSLFGRLLVSTADGEVPAEFLSMGSSLNSEISPDGINISATVLAEDAYRAIELIFGLIKREFTEPEILAVRDLLLPSLRATNPLRDLISETMFMGLPMGASSEVRAEDLENMATADFLAYVQRVSRPERVSVAIVGNTDMNTVDKAVSELQKWSVAPQAESAEEIEEDNDAEYTPIKIVPQSGNFAAIYILRRLNPVSPAEYYSLQVANKILEGESTTSRLAAVQVGLGLQSPIQSSLNITKQDSGHLISALAPSENAVATFSLIMQQLETLFSGTIGNSRLLEQEVSDAKNNLMGSFLSSNQTSARVSKFMTWSMFYGFENHSITAHAQMIDAISKEDLLKVIEGKFFPKLNSLILLGSENDLSSQFADFGDIRVIER